MQWCTKHWEALKDGVKARKLWRFVPESGHELFENAQLELKGYGGPFDPLTGSMWQLTEHVMSNINKSQGPAAAFSAFGDPHWCPMCTVQESYEVFLKTPEAETRDYKSRALDAQGWIDRKLDQALEHAKHCGMKLDGE